MIQISNLTKEYGKTVIFSNLNYTFERDYEEKSVNKIFYDNDRRKA